MTSVGVIAKLNGESAERLMEYSKQIEEKFRIKYSIGYPHFTLFIGETSNLKRFVKAMNQIVKHLQPFRITTTTIRKWDEFVYLSVKTNKAIKSNNAYLCMGLAGIAKSNKHFSMEEYKPHITIAKIPNKRSKLPKLDIAISQRVENIRLTSQLPDKSFRTIKEMKM